MGVVPHATDALARELHQTSQGKSKKHATGSHRAAAGGGRSVVGKGTRDEQEILARETGKEVEQDTEKTTENVQAHRQLIARAGAERAARLSLGEDDI